MKSLLWILILTVTAFAFVSVHVSSVHVSSFHSSPSVHPTPIHESTPIHVSEHIPITSPAHPLFPVLFGHHPSTVKDDTNCKDTTPLTQTAQDSIQQIHDKEVAAVFKVIFVCGLILIALISLFILIRNIHKE